MKKITGLCVALLAMFAVSSAFAGKEVLIPQDQLPQAAQDYLAQNFAEKEVSHVRLYTDFTDRDYKVYFADGDNIEFNVEGEVEEIECPNSEVPEACIPEQALSAIRQIFPNAKILEIEFAGKKGSTEVKLSTGLKLEFNADYTWVDIDD